MTLQEALRQAQEEPSKSIGTLGERTLHAALKYYLQPDPQFHEVRVGRWVADIKDENGITEIQTRSFNRLLPKLEWFLSQGKVTVVYPVAAVKRVCWVDPQTGETTPFRKSPKRKGPGDILYELYAIRRWLDHKNLTLRILLLEMDEYRFLDGWSRDRKRGSSRKDRIPTAVLGEVAVGGSLGYGGLIPPDGLPEKFTSKEFAKASGTGVSGAQRGLALLTELGEVERIGKQGRAYQYRIAKGKNNCKAD